MDLYSIEKGKLHFLNFSVYARMYARGFGRNLGSQKAAPGSSHQGRILAAVESIPGNSQRATWNHPTTTRAESGRRWRAAAHLVESWRRWRAAAHLVESWQGWRAAAHLVESWQRWRAAAHLVESWQGWRAAAHLVESWQGWRAAAKQI